MLLASIARDAEDSPPQSCAYEELVEVVTRAVNWPAEKEYVHKKKKKYTEVWRSWEKTVPYRVYSTETSHYSSIINK